MRSIQDRPKAAGRQTSFLEGCSVKNNFSVNVVATASFDRMGWESISCNQFNKKFPYNFPQLHLCCAATGNRVQESMISEL